MPSEICHKSLGHAAQIFNSQHLSEDVKIIEDETIKYFQTNKITCLISNKIILKISFSGLKFPI